MNERQTEVLRLLGGDTLVNRVTSAAEGLVKNLESRITLDEFRTTDIPTGVFTQLTKLMCENCGATLTICGRHLLECEYCETVYLVSNVGELIGNLGEYDITPREINLNDYFYTGLSHDNTWR